MSKREKRIEIDFLLDLKADLKQQKNNTGNTCNMSQVKT
jgi:hypothetical protein